MEVYGINESHFQEAGIYSNKGNGVKERGREIEREGGRETEGEGDRTTGHRVQPPTRRAEGDCGHVLVERGLPIWQDERVGVAEREFTVDAIIYGRPSDPACRQGPTTTAAASAHHPICVAAWLARVSAHS